MKIRIGEQEVEVAVVKDGQTLCLGLYGQTDIVEVYSAFQPNAMPEITIYDDEGHTNAIYANHKVTQVAWNENNIQVNLLVDPLEVSEATRIREEMGEQEESAAVSDDAIAELAELLAGLEERVTALEEK